MADSLSADRVNDNYDDDRDVDALGQASVKLLPTMFKFITDLHAAVSKGRNQKDGDSMKTGEEAHSSPDPTGNLMTSYQQLQDVIEALSALARHAPKDFLGGLFKKVMHRLLDEIQSENCDTEKVCSLLSLSQALVASEALDEANVSFLYRALKSLIKNDEHGPRVQKRAYKLLAEICQRHHSFVVQPDQITELLTLLAGTIMTSQVSARHMRLKCMNILVDGIESTNSTKMVRYLQMNRNAIFTNCLSNQTP